MKETTTPLRGASWDRTTLILLLIAAVVGFLFPPLYEYMFFHMGGAPDFVYSLMHLVERAAIGIAIYFVIVGNWKAAAICYLLHLLDYIFHTNMVGVGLGLTVLSYFKELLKNGYWLGMTLFLHKKLKHRVLEPLILLLAWLALDIFKLFTIDPQIIGFNVQRLLIKLILAGATVYGLLYFLDRELLKPEPAAKSAGQPDWKSELTKKTAATVQKTAEAVQKTTEAVQKTAAAVQKTAATVQASPKQYAAPSAGQGGEKICPRCKRHYGSDDCFCQVCGISLKRVCPHCGTEADEDDRFCQHCGKAL